MNTREARIPFTGFYGSTHQEELDAAEAQLTQDESGDPIPELAEQLWPHVQWKPAHLAYSKLYAERFVEAFLDETGFDLKGAYKDMESPREYNFTTDRIFIDIPVEVIKPLLDKADKKALDLCIREHFTNRSGFISFYANSLKRWLAEKPVEQWGANQLGTLIESVWMEYSDQEALEAYNLLEYDRGNGAFDTIVYDALDDEGRAIVSKASDIREALNG